MHPDTELVSSRTGFDRSGYQGYPYTHPSLGDYRSDDFLLFPVANWDTRLGAKQRVLGVIAGGESRAYRLVALGGVPLNDELGGEPVAVFGTWEHDLALAYSRRVEEQVLTFERAPGQGVQYPFDLQDLETGTRWTMEGLAVAGPLTGQRLTRARQVIAYWFAWAAFHPDTGIYGS